MIAADTKSYPYLAIARRFGVDYGLVLSFADWLSERHDNVEPLRALEREVRFAICAKYSELN